MNLEPMILSAEIVFGMSCATVLGVSVYNLIFAKKMAKEQYKKQEKKSSLQLNAGTDYFGE